jgi:hypothetical protein
MASCSTKNLPSCFLFPSTVNRTFMHIHGHKGESHCTVRGCASDMQLILLVMPFGLHNFFNPLGTQLMPTPAEVLARTAAEHEKKAQAEHRRQAQVERDLQQKLARNLPKQPNGRGKRSVETGRSKRERQSQRDSPRVWRNFGLGLRSRRQRWLLLYQEAANYLNLLTFVIVIV